MLAKYLDVRPKSKLSEEVLVEEHEIERALLPYVAYRHVKLLWVYETSPITHLVIR